MDTKYIIFVVAVFIATFFAIEAFYYWYKARFGSRAKQIKRRLANISNNNYDQSAIYQGILKNRYADQANPLNKFLAKFKIINKLDDLMMQSGQLWSFKKFFQITTIAGLFGLLAGFLLKLNFILFLFLFLIAAFIPLAHLTVKKNKRIKKFEEQLPEALDSICRSLKAGHAFNSAFNLVGEEFPEPIASEFRITMEENKLGVSMSDAMQNLAKRVPITDLKFFVIAVLIQRESGGNLGEILSNISKVIRQRFILTRQIGVLTSEVKMSAKILGVMPLVMLGIMSALNPTYASYMFHTPTGQYWLKVGFGMMIVGILWMRSLIKIKM